MMKHSQNEVVQKEQVMVLEKELKRLDIVEGGKQDHLILH